MKELRKKFTIMISLVLPSFAEKASPVSVSARGEEDVNTGAAITIDGIKDTSNNLVENQTWQFNGIEWIKE